jgi:hypothetical protein
MRRRGYSQLRQAYQERKIFLFLTAVASTLEAIYQDSREHCRHIVGHSEQLRFITVFGWRWSNDGASRKDKLYLFGGIIKKAGCKNFCNRPKGFF